MDTSSAIKISPKQNDVFELLQNPQVIDILFGGGAGGSKSITVCLFLVIECRKYPGIRIGLGRKELKRLKQTTIVTLLREVHPMLGVKPGEYEYSEQKGLLKYVNGSEIQLVDLAYQPSDPNFDTLGSTLFTHVIMEEVGEIKKKARDVFMSRKNRFMNDKYNIVGKSISTCNPSQNFAKTEYFEPYKKLGGGEQQIWPDGEVIIDGERKEAYRAFVRSLVTDNPFIALNYIEDLKRLPDVERRRLLLGDWDFEDDDFMLFKPLTLSRMTLSNIMSGQRFVGVDISDTGKDATIISLLDGKTISDLKEIQVDKSKVIGEQIGLEIIKYAQQNGLGPESVGIDSLGVGASTRDFLRSRRWYVKEFVAGAPSIENYQNLRSEMLWKMSVAMQNGQLSLFEHMPFIEELKRQLMAHSFETLERKIKALSKDDVKEKIGRSPDHSDATMIAFWVSLGDNDPRNDPSRIII